MESSIEKMKATLRNRLIVFSFVTSGLGFLVCLQVYNLFSPLVGGQDYADFIHGVQLGLIIGFELVCVFYIAKYIGILKDEKLIRAEYIKENDERTMMIASKTGIQSFNISAAILIIAAIISGYFSFAAFVALLGALMVEVLIRAVLYSYYSKKY